MKKFLFLISCLVLFGLTGCKKDVEKQKYSITITNICEEDILVNVGYIEDNFNWDNAGYWSFKKNQPLSPNESVTVTGELAANEWFLVGGKISGEFRYWAVNTSSKYVYFREYVGEEGRVLLSKYRKDVSDLPKTQYSFTIKNICAQDLTVIVGEVPKTAGEYLWNYANGYTVTYEKTVKAGESLDVTGKLYDGFSFCVDVYDGENFCNGWAVDNDDETFLIYNGNPEKPTEVWGQALSKKESKIKDNGDSDIHPLTITNKFTEPVIVFAGDVPYTIKNNQNVYNKNAANPESFLGKVVLEPNEDIKIYGKLAEGKAFYVTVWPLYGSGGSWWAFTPPNNQADVVVHDEYKVAINWSNTSSGSSSSSQILLSTRNSYFPVSK